MSKPPKKPSAVTSKPVVFEKGGYRPTKPADSKPPTSKPLSPITESSEGED
jgi:hypothetical protein